MSQNQDRPAMFQLADRAVDGQLARMIRRWRAAGVSLRSIQALLDEELGVKPALETVRQWVRIAEDEAPNGEGEAA